MRRAVGAVVVMAIIGAWNLASNWLVVRGIGQDVPGVVIPDSLPVEPSRAAASATAPGTIRRAPRTVPSSFSRDPLLFLSTAPPESLDLLPGIGPVLAARILEARETRGAFATWDDVLDVKGIGPRTIARWQASRQ